MEYEEAVKMKRLYDELVSELCSVVEELIHVVTKDEVASADRERILELLDRVRQVVERRIQASDPSATDKSQGGITAGSNRIRLESTYQSLCIMSYLSRDVNLGRDASAEKNEKE